jgi:mono/diheme cytochrome c family protein
MAHLQRFLIALFAVAIAVSMAIGCQKNPFPQGEALYRTHCASCHMDDGLGLKGIIPPLAGADYVARDPAAVACIIRNGISDTIRVNGAIYSEPMQAIPQLTEFQIANIINYINIAWGNDYGYVSMPEIRQRLGECTFE